MRYSRLTLVLLVVSSFAFMLQPVCAQAQRVYVAIREAPTSVNSHLLWFDRDGSNGGGLKNGDGFGAVDVDPVGLKLYWTDYQGLYRSNLDGSGTQLVASLGGPYQVPTAPHIMTVCDGWMVYEYNRYSVISSRLDGTSQLEFDIRDHCAFDEPVIVGLAIGPELASPVSETTWGKVKSLYQP